MTKSQDWWVLLLVISVLSTLLIVIVILFCVWITVRFCIPMYSLRQFRRQSCRGEPVSVALPKSCDFHEAIQDNPQSMLERQKRAHKLIERTGTSEELGYKSEAAKNISFPALPSPKTWTPSPPFPKGGNKPTKPQTQYPGGILICPCHHSNKHQEYQAEEPPINRPLHNHQDVEKQLRIPSLHYHQEQAQVHFCPMELKNKLKCVHREEPRISRHSYCRRTLSSTAGFLNVPENTPNSVKSKAITRHKSIYANISSSSKSSLENIKIHNEATTPERRLKLKRKGKIPQNSSKPKVFPSTYSAMGSSAFEIIGDESLRRSKIKVCPILELSQPRNLLQDEDIEANNSCNTKKTVSYEEQKETCPEYPVTIFLESPTSNSSTERSAALNQPSPKYWRICHQPQDCLEGSSGIQTRSAEFPSRKTNERAVEGDSDALPSMSWDHLTPDPSPLHDNVAAKLAVDPQSGKVVYFNARNFIPDEYDPGFKISNEKSS